MAEEKKTAAKPAATKTTAKGGNQNGTGSIRNGGNKRFSSGD